MAAEVSPASSLLRDRFLGSWRLISWDIRDARGQVSQPLGENPIGQLSYDAAGRMCAHLARRGLKPFAHDNWLSASQEEKALAWSNFCGYFGTYTIDDTAGAVTHHIEGSWFPNFNDGDQVRDYAFDGNRLVLSADAVWGYAKMVWEKFEP